MFVENRKIDAQLFSREQKTQESKHPTTWTKKKPSNYLRLLFTYMRSPHRTQHTVAQHILDGTIVGCMCRYYYIYWQRSIAICVHLHCVSFVWQQLLFKWIRQTHRTFFLVLFVSAPETRFLCFFITNLNLVISTIRFNFCRRSERYG